MSTRFVSLQDIADDLGIPLETVRKWRLRKKLPAGIKVGNHVRIDRREYEAWLASKAA
jgi:excisionase family DNA binding protein